jgi:hypothetical protein
MAPNYSRFSIHQERKKCLDEEKEYQAFVEGRTIQVGPKSSGQAFQSMCTEPSCKYQVRFVNENRSKKDLGPHWIRHEKWKGECLDHCPHCASQPRLNKRMLVSNSSILEATAPTNKKARTNGGMNVTAVTGLIRREHKIDVGYRTVHRALEEMKEELSPTRKAGVRGI